MKDKTMTALLIGAGMLGISLIIATVIWAGVQREKFKAEKPKLTAIMHIQYPDGRDILATQEFDDFQHINKIAGKLCVAANVSITVNDTLVYECIKHW